MKIKTFLHKKCWMNLLLAGWYYKIY
jgi:hypothetical protein